MTTYVPHDAQRTLAAAGIRDEHVSPTPIILESGPMPVGYYRLLNDHCNQGIGLSLNDDTLLCNKARLKEMAERRQVVEDRGKVRIISRISWQEAAEEDFRFWYEQLTPGERAEAVADPVETARGCEGAMPSRDYEEFIAASGLPG